MVVPARPALTPFIKERRESSMFMNGPPSRPRPPTGDVSPKASPLRATPDERNPSDARLFLNWSSVKQLPDDHEDLRVTNSGDPGRMNPDYHVEFIPISPHNSTTVARSSLP